MVDVNLTPEQLEKQLKDKKWEDAQVKGLAAWANTYLKPRECVIHKLPDDVKSGVCLLNLLDALGQPLNQSVGKYVSKPKHRIEMAQNCNQALNFAQQQLGVRLVGVGAEDILDGNLKLILGMLWSTFRKLGLGSLSQGGDKAGNPEDDLLRWYQQMCQPYGVKVDNFKSSFNDGLAWAALIDQFDPDYLPFEKLNKNDPASVLTQVFDVAEKKLGIPKLLDVEDLLKGEADERSITLYSSLFYHAWTTNQEQIKLANANRALRKGASDVSSDLAAINAAIAALQAEHDRLAPLAAAWKAQLGELDDRIAALLAEIARLQAEKARLEAEIKRLQDERAARAKADLAKLRQEEASLQGSNDEADRLRRGREAAQLLADRDELLERLRKGVGATGGEGGQARDASLLGHGALSLRAALDGLAQELRAHVNALHAEWRTLEAEDGGAATAEARRAFEKEMRDREAEVRKLKGKSEEQAKACARAAEGTTRTLLSVLSVKDAVNEMGKWVDRKGYMMAHEDGRRWKKRWFVLRGFDLLYYEKREDQDAEEDSGRLSLEDSTVQSRDSDEAKLQWVIHIATTVVAADGQRKKEVLQVAAKTQEDRDDWFAALHSRALYTHYLALAARHAERPDPRFVAMFEKRLLSLVQLDNLPLLAHHVKVVEKFIEAHPETVRFSFSRASLADDALSSLAAALKSRPQTASLVFAGNAITQGGAVALSDAIAAWGASPALTELNVSGNRIPAAGVVALLAAVKGCKEMHTLDVSGNLLDDKAVGAYVAAVKGMRNITEVQLRKVGLKDKALAEVSEVLKGAECAIVSVDVSGNEVGDEGVARLCEALKANKSVRRVNLGGNAVTAKGVAAVHEMLKVNETVEEVDLSGMRSIVGGKELTALAEMKGVMFTGFLPMRM